LDRLSIPNDFGTFDMIFDRGCYHHLHYNFSSEYADSLCKLAKPNAKILIISCNAARAPGVTENYIREDFQMKRHEFTINKLEEISRTDRDGTNRNELRLLMTINTR
jgi:hypothetical protein